MKFPSFLLCGAITLLLPTLSSAYNSPQDEIMPNVTWHTIYIKNDHIEDLPQGGFSNDPEIQVTYYEQNGFAIYNGDVNLGPVKNVEDHKSGDHHRLRQLIKRGHSIFPTDVEQRWPDATLTYKYATKEAEEGLKALVDQALNYWTAAAPYLKFVKLPTEQEHKPGTLLITMTTGAGACWAPLGWCKDCYLTMQLDTWNCNVATYVHEFGHALGLQHEHQRPDRDDYMYFNCSALSDYGLYGTTSSTCPGDAKKCCEGPTCWGWACAFRLIEYLDWHGPIDLVSVMMYTQWTFSNGYYPALEGINGYKVPNGDTPYPSDGDKLRICEIYHEQCKNTTAVCGNGKLEYPEECDDGNTVDGDGCSSKCTIENIDPNKKCEVCNPSPIENKCDITTSCITTSPDGNHYCACRAGYKANPGYDTTQLLEWRLPFDGQEYRVFVKPGVICDQLCESWQTGGKDGVLCGEVPTKTDCK